MVKKNLQKVGTGSLPEANITLTGENSVASGGNSSVRASNRILLSPGFIAASGSTFSASIFAGEFLQSVDFRYSIRNELTNINNTSFTADSKNDDSNDLFGMEIIYDGVDEGIGNTAYFNGMISAVKWKTKTPSSATPSERSYKFSYDVPGRLTGAIYADRTGTGAWGNKGGYDEKGISYDQNGNMLTLNRNALIGGSVVDVDQLNYIYASDQLNNISDGSGINYGAYGFRNLTGSGSVYQYNTNGALTLDTKKGLTLIYNDLGKSSRITMNGKVGRYIDYTYDATGAILRKQAYDNNVLVKTTDYVDGAVYENNVLSYFGMAEGRVRNNSGTLKYEYMIADQMGNVRVSFEEESGNAVVRQENSYYPFGLIMPGGYTPSSANRKLYNEGSEWQDDFGNLPDFYSTFYRNYDASLGRFISVDPKAEVSDNISVYHYASNNPVMFNDPLGDVFLSSSTPTRRVGPGSGNYWADGFLLSDWSADGGSAMYKSAIASGMRSLGQTLYYTDRNGSRNPLENNRNNGEFGYYSYSGEITSESWSNTLRQIAEIYSGYSAGVHAEWVKVDINQGGDNALNYFDKNNGDIGNCLAGVGYVSGAVGNWAGNIIKSRSLYGAPGATTILSPPLQIFMFLLVH